MFSDMWPLFFTPEALGYFLGTNWLLSLEHLTFSYRYSGCNSARLVERLGQVQSRPISGDVSIANAHGPDGADHVVVLYFPICFKLALCIGVWSFTYGIQSIFGAQL